MEYECGNFFEIKVFGGRVDYDMLTNEICQKLMEKENWINLKVLDINYNFVISESNFLKK